MQSIVLSVLLKGGETLVLYKGHLKDMIETYQWILPYAQGVVSNNHSD